MKIKSDLNDRDTVIQRLREEAFKLQQEIKQLINSSSDEKEKMRAEYLSAIERQKQEVAGLQNQLSQTNKEGQDIDARQKAQSEENARLRQKLAESEKSLADQTGEMA